MSLVGYRSDQTKIIMFFSDIVIVRNPRQKTHTSYDTGLVINVEYET